MQHFFHDELTLLILTSLSLYLSVYYTCQLALGSIDYYTLCYYIKIL